MSPEESQSWVGRRPAKLTPAQYYDGVCEICKERPGRILSRDHCHKTGRYRGSLCLRCNFGLGHFKDDIQWLQNAISYLQRHSND